MKIPRSMQQFLGLSPPATGSFGATQPRTARRAVRTASATIRSALKRSASRPFAESLATAAATTPEPIEWSAADEKAVTTAERIRGARIMAYGVKRGIAGPALALYESGLSANAAIRVLASFHTDALPVAAPPSSPGAVPRIERLKQQGYIP